MLIVKLLLAFFLPPIAALIQVGVTKHFWINLLLTIITLGLGGVIHAFWLVLTDQQA
ncbi:MAG: YqaE/Pmp3 family membrane protein [Planctomycetota bacterium]|jgi:uncharacterized membrane protein YqaE (UPF0057 family)